MNFADERHAAFLRLFLQHQGELRAFVRSVVWDRFQCEDVVQEAALVLWKEFERYDPTRPFAPWARGVTANLVLKNLAKTRRSVAFSPEAIEAMLDAHNRTQHEPSREQMALRTCLTKLPDRSRRLVELRYQQSLTLQEMADNVGSTLDAVHKALSRIRSGLLGCIQRELARGLS